MAARIPLDGMSLEEKIQAMESIWDDLCAHADQLHSPDWHGDLLAQRQAALDGGQDSFEDWSSAKEKIKRQTS